MTLSGATATATNDRVPDSSGMHFGTIEEGRALVGIAQPSKVGQIPVNIAMIRLFCGMVQDANPSYWDEDYAERVWGGVPSPAALLFSWVLPLPWNPAFPYREGPLCVRVPLPGIRLANVNQSAEFYAPIMCGDELSMVETLVGISDEKSTKLGSGYFITTGAVFTRNGDERVIARLTNVLFRYMPAAGASA